MQTSIVDPDVRRRRPAADAPRRRRDHLEERPGRRVGRDRHQGARSARRDRRDRGRVSDRRRRAGRAPGTSGSTAASCRPTARTCRCSIAASSSATGSSRRCASAAADPTELAEHIARLRRSAAGLDIALPADIDAALATGIADLLAADGPRRAGRRRLGPDHGLARRRSAAAACCRPTRSSTPTIAIQAWPVVAAAGRPPRARPPPRRLGGPARPGQPAGDAQDHVARRLRLRPARGAPRRRRRRAVPDHRRPPVGGDDREHLPRPPRAGDGRPELATPSLDCAILPGHDPVVAARPGAPASASGRSRAG